MKRKETDGKETERNGNTVNVVVNNIESNGLVPQASPRTILSTAAMRVSCHHLTVTRDDGRWEVLTPGGAESETVKLSTAVGQFHATVSPIYRKSRQSHVYCESACEDVINFPLR